MTKPDQSPGAQSPGDQDALGSEGAQANQKAGVDKKAVKKPGVDKKAAAAKAGAVKTQPNKAAVNPDTQTEPGQQSKTAEPVASKATTGEDSPGPEAAVARPVLDSDADLDAIVAEALRSDTKPGAAKPDAVTSAEADPDGPPRRTPTEDIFYLDMGDLNALAADELTRVAAERDEYLTALQRLKADFDNNRKRTLRQQTEILERANQGLLTKLLPVLDALDLAMRHASEASEGEDAQAIVQIGTLLRNTLATEGLERIDAVNAPFDPTIHDAVAREPASEEDSSADQTVSNILRAGYKLKGRVIRPAMVMVRG